MNIITSETPTDWKDLQKRSALILEECGFTVEIEKKMSTVRGDVEIDVFAKENIKGRHYTIICECKHWKSKVPQTIIHGFRTVISDIGANRGYIISTNGFQTGAYTAAHSTNVDLVSWVQFQEQFCEIWLDNHFSPIITKRLDRLFGYTEPLVQKWMCDIPDNEVKVVKALRKKYSDLASLLSGFTTYSTYFTKKGFPSLPLKQNLTEWYNNKNCKIPAAILNAIGYSDLLEVALYYGERGIAQFKAVRDRNNL